MAGRSQGFKDRDCTGTIRACVSTLLEAIEKARKQGLEVELFDGQDNRLAWNDLTAVDISLRAEVKRRF